MRRLLVAGVLALALAGCGATADATRDAVEAPASAGAAVERCTERLLGDVQGEELTAEEEEAARRYVESTYCARFAERGWVYDDGALSIDAHTWATEGGEEVCEEALSEQQEGGTAGSTRTVPCDELDAEEPGIIECALLRHVRESEVREHLDGLQRRHGSVECDDGTALTDLGAQ